MNMVKCRQISWERVATELNACGFGINGFNPEQDGWLTNAYFENDVEHIWRSNIRVSNQRFWAVLKDAVSGFHGETILFHDGKAGWRKRGNERIGRFLSVGNVAYAIDFLRRHTYYSREQWEYGNKSDNYYLLSPENRVIVAFTHHGEFYCFSRNENTLSGIAKIFLGNRLSMRKSFGQLIKIVANCEPQSN